MIIKIPIKPNLLEDINRTFIEFPSYTAACAALDLSEEEQRTRDSK